MGRSIAMGVAQDGCFLREISATMDDDWGYMLYDLLHMYYMIQQMTWGWPHFRKPSMLGEYDQWIG